MSRKSKIFLVVIAVILILSGVVIYVLNSRLIRFPSALLPDIPELALSSDDRILIFAPHPDDEVLGCGGVIQKAVRMELPVKIVFLTNGDFNEWSFFVYRKRPAFSATDVQKMGMVRRAEAIKAARSFGLSENNLIFLGYPDFGTLTILSMHWDESEPFTGFFSKQTSVSYEGSYHEGAPFTGNNILGDIESIISDFKPTKIFVSHPADQHPDHQAMFLFTRIALWNLKPDPEPELLPYLIHFKKWPKPRGYYPNYPLFPVIQSLDQIAWIYNPLDEEEVQAKENALRLHSTQFKANSKYLNSFIRTNELFGNFPEWESGYNAAKESIEDVPFGFAYEMSEELSNEEREAFVRFENRSISVEDHTLIISAEFSKRFTKGAGLSTYVIGYRDDVPFSDMPKLRIRLGSSSTEIFNNGEKISADSIEIDRTSGQITIKIPLELLNNPDRILTGSKTYLSRVPLDFMAWREIDLK